MLSVIVVSFNAREFLRSCLNSLRQYEPDAEVIVVDNASHDGSADMVAAEFPEVRLVQTGRNAGFAAANNAGLAVATRPFVVLLNSDTELSDGSLTRCVQRMLAEPRLGAVHPRLVGADGRPQQCLHRFPTLGESVRKALRLASQTENRPERTWLAGTALVIRREALESIGGGLDSGYFMYWEDADLSARLRRAGWGLAVQDDAEVLHFGGASGGGPDAARRADLYAWYCYGRHRWFRRNRPIPEGIAVWLLEACDIPRKLFRGMIRTARREVEWAHALVTARVLAFGLIGRTPPTP